jgi:hypothetical protein
MSDPAIQHALPSMASSSAPAVEVVVYRHGADERAAHDHATCREIARRIAALKRVPFGGEHDAGNAVRGARYFVPTSTLVGIEDARALGIEDEHDLFGGVVPHAFVATKSITHPLVDDAATAPAGWSVTFGQRVRAAVLDGYSAFCVDDALRAGVALLAHGPVRVKRALGIGGAGQVVANDRRQLERAVLATDAAELTSYGISLEQNLTDVTTFSVGRVEVDDLVASYCGTQGVTQNNAGQPVYGGSTLLVARGDFDALLRLDHAPAVRLAIDRARRYDAAAFECFDGLIASRRNYDVAHGRDARGRARTGVLEQSWRVGGASGAEVEALVAFRDDATLRAVRASTREVYGPQVTAPPGATVYFAGNDERAGPLTKYTVVEPHVHA